MKVLESFMIINAADGDAKVLINH